MTTLIEVSLNHLCQPDRQVAVFQVDPNAEPLRVQILTDADDTYLANVWDGRDILIREEPRDAHIVVPADDTASTLEPGVEYKPLPVAGYLSQSAETIEIANTIKYAEEAILQLLDDMKADPAFDQRWLQLGRTHLEQGFMAVIRSVFRPERVTIPEDLA